MPSPLQFDMVFLDHLKPLYTVDLKVMEEEGLIGPVSRLSFASGHHHSLLFRIIPPPKRRKNLPIVGDNRYLRACSCGAVHQAHCVARMPLAFILTLALSSLAIARVARADSPGNRDSSRQRRQTR